MFKTFMASDFFRQINWTDVRMASLGFAIFAIFIASLWQMD